MTSAPSLPLTGGCGCGAIRFEISEPLVASAYGLCTRCQRRSGTAVAGLGQDRTGLVRAHARRGAGARMVARWRPRQGLLRRVQLGDQALRAFDDRPRRSGDRLMPALAVRHLGQRRDPPVLELEDMGERRLVRMTALACPAAIVAPDEHAIVDTVESRSLLVSAPSERSWEVEHRVDDGHRLPVGAHFELDETFGRFAYPPVREATTLSLGRREIAELRVDATTGSVDKPRACLGRQLGYE